MALIRKGLETEMGQRVSQVIALIFCFVKTEYFRTNFNTQKQS